MFWWRNGYSLMRPYCHKVEASMLRQMTLFHFLWAQKDGTCSLWYNGHHIMFLLTSSYHSIDAEFNRRFTAKTRHLLQFFSSSYVLIIGVRRGENSEVIKTIETVYGSSIAKCISSVDDNRIWNWNGNIFLLLNLNCKLYSFSTSKVPLLVDSMEEFGAN